MAGRVETEADATVRQCLSTSRSFALVAGAGSGKTSSLVEALEFIRASNGARLNQNGQRVACITYTKRATEVIRGRLGVDDLFVVSTLHSFLWGEIRHFQRDIREALRLDRIPSLIASAREKDNGGMSKQARRAREVAADLEAQIIAIDAVGKFDYVDSPYGIYRDGVLGHDDIIEITSYLLSNNATLRRLLGFRYPYIFVDEAQDTFGGVVSGLNAASPGSGFPLVGYFGDPWQQIYEGRAGEFVPPEGGLRITKAENFRCSESVIRLLNAFRTDVVQFAAGANRNKEGSVRIRLIESERPELARNRFSELQLSRSAARLDLALAEWGWLNRNDIIQLFLVRQMIARRLGFPDLNRLFTGAYSSARSQDRYESGEHFLLKPFVTLICPLLEAKEAGDERRIIHLLRTQSPEFDVHGPNAGKSLAEMIARSIAVLDELTIGWATQSVGDILRLCKGNGLIKTSQRLDAHLGRVPRCEEYDEETYSSEKEDWLCDAFFLMPTTELPRYVSFMQANTPYSTQHGVKGEEYANVLVVMDDLEAGWNNYSFTKLLTPGLAGEPTEGQSERGRKLAYVCFSRSTENLRLVLFTPNPDAASRELIARGLFLQSQIEISRI